MRSIAAGTLSAVLAIAVIAPSAHAVETSKEYVAEVNPICKSFGAAAKRVPKKVRRSGDPVVDFIRQTAAYSKLLKNTTRRIRRVKPPASDRKEVKSWTGGLVRQRKLIDGFIAAAKRRDAGRAEELARKVAKVERRNGRKARALGLPACAGGSKA